jgi:hypothetical protein
MREWWERLAWAVIVLSAVVIIWATLTGRW